MPKSLMYVPGLALEAEIAVPQVAMAAFQTKVERVFAGDVYMRDMVKNINQKGAVPADCRKALRWVSIPKGAAADPRAAAGVRHANAKAFQKAGAVSTNIIAKPHVLPKSLAPGQSEQPVGMTMVIGGVGVLTPCNAPEWIGQPTSATITTTTLASLVKGDTLYIIGHSSAMGGSLTYKYPVDPHIVSNGVNGGCPGWQHAEKRHIDPVTLGSLMIDEGLPTGIKFDIAIVACYSAGLEDATLQTVQSFAQRLAGTLDARGFKCRVYGATGLTSSGATPGNERELRVRAAKGATKVGNTITLDSQTHSVPEVVPGEPFYRRFFRFF